MWLFRSHPPRSMWRVVATLNVDLLDYRAISLTTARIGAGLTVPAHGREWTPRISLVRSSSLFNSNRNCDDPAPHCDGVLTQGHKECIFCQSIIRG